MQVTIGGRRISLAARNALGDGGEATVTRHQDLAVKVYHAPSPHRAAKLQALMAALPTLPDAVVAPRELVFDARGREVVGFTMRALMGHEPVALLSRRRARATRGIGARSVMDLFLGALDTLLEVHRAGAVVGDLNDMNEMFSDDGRTLAWIDVDSWQLAGFGCDVATEPFLDPRLYGPDLAQPVLTRHGELRVFDAASDWYAFAVLLFRSLTLVHPYGGVDPALQTLPRRAAAKKSVFAPGVRYPSTVGYALEVLSDELASAMRAVFDRGDRTPLSRPLLADYRAGLRGCNACGADYPGDRARCPSCASLAPPVMVQSRADCSARDLIEARGPILALTASPSLLRCVALEDGALWLYTSSGHTSRRVELCPAARGVPVQGIELGSEVCAVSQSPSPSGRGWDGSLHGSAAPLTIHALEGDRPVAKVELGTERFGQGLASFACGGAEVFRLARGVVLRGHFRGGHYEEEPVATTMVDQTRVFTSSEARTGSPLLALSRVFNERHLLLLAGGRRTDLPVPALAPGESLVDEDAIFSGNAVAYLCRTRLAGRGRVRTLVLSFTGEVLASYVETEEERAAGGVIHGGAFSQRSLLFATDRGLARERFGAAGDAHPEHKRLLAATEPFVAHGALLAPFAEGIAVAHGARVRLLSLPTPPQQTGDIR